METFTALDVSNSAPAGRWVSTSGRPPASTTRGHPRLGLPGFSLASREELGARVRDIHASGADSPERVLDTVDNASLGDLARGVAGRLGDKVGVAPRLFLKKLIADVLDRVDQLPDFGAATC